MGLVYIGIGFVAFVALIVFGARWGGAAVQRRRDRLVAGTILQLGLAPIAALPDDLPAFELLNTGKNRSATTIHRGSVHGADVVLFDYTFYDPRMTGFTGLHYHNHFATTTVACAKGSWMNLPAFAIEPSLGEVVKAFETQMAQQMGEGALGSLAKTVMSLAEGMVGMQSGRRFPDRPDVTYLVRSGEEATVGALFTPPVLDFFRDHPGWIVEGLGDWVLVTFSWQFRQPGLDLRAQRADTGRLPPEQLGALVRAATDTLDAFRNAAR